MIWFGIRKMMTMMNRDYTSKTFWISIKNKDKCLFSRRNGYTGKLIGSYSIRVRLFGKDLI